MGSLSPRTRNAQVALFQSGEVDFLVATDAIGMGLNMDVDHVAFAALRKFDGRRMRWLHTQEIGQIAGRAGRYRRDGTFGVTGDAPEMDADVVAAVEGHAFAPLTAAEWRNARLDFSSLAGLMRSLAAPPPKARPQAFRREPGRDDAAPARRRRAHRPPLPRPRQSRPPVGRLPDARLPQDLAGGAHAADRRHVRAPDPEATAACRTSGCRASSPRSTGSRATSTCCRPGSRACARSPMSPIAATGSPIRPTGRARRARSRTGCPTRCTSS